MVFFRKKYIHQVKWTFLKKKELSHELKFRQKKHIIILSIFILRAQQNHKIHKMSKLFLSWCISVNHLKLLKRAQKIVILKTTSSKHIQFSRLRIYLLFPKITFYFSSLKPHQIPTVFIITNSTCNQHYIVSYFQRGRVYKPTDAKSSWVVGVGLGFFSFCFKLGRFSLATWFNTSNIQPHNRFSICNWSNMLTSTF